MKKNFKMAVISLSFLIIGGILMACGTKKTAEEVTTEQSIEKTAEEVELFKYKFQFPDNFRFYSYDDNAITYKSKDNELTNITIASTQHDDDITNIGEAEFKDTVETLFKGSTIDDAEYFETKNYRSYTCSAKEVQNGKNFDYIVYEHTDRSTVFQIFCFMVDAEKEEIEQNKESMKEIYNNFIELNY